MDTCGMDEKTKVLFSAKTLLKLVSKIVIGSIPEHLDTACLEFTGTLDKDNYGRVHVIIDGKMHRVPASRLALEVALGAILPDDTLALHHCDNPKCVGPLHLYPGTHADNMADMVRRGRNKKANT